MSAEPTGTNTEAPFRATIWSKPFVLTWLSTWMIFLGFYFLLPTLPAYFVKIGGKESDVGWLIGLFTLTAMIVRPIAGRLADTKGKTWTMFFGGALLAATVVFYWFVKTPAQLLTLRFFHGIGWGIYLTAAVTLIADIAHPTQRATMTGHYFLANTLAMVVGPWLGTVILARANNDYLWLFTSTIGLTAVALATIWPLHASAPVVTATTNGRWISPRAWLPAITILFAAFTYGGVVSFLPVYASPKQVSIFYCVYALSLGLSRPIGGYIADKVSRRAVVLPCMLLLAASMAALAWKLSTMELVIVAILYGIGFGGAGPALNALLIDRVLPEERGAAMGMYAAGFELGLSVGSVTLGAVLGWKNFQVMWLVAAVAPFVGFAVFGLGSRKK